MIEIGLGHYLTLAAIIFAIGVIGIFLNRKYVGIDISEEYVKLARDRISTSLDNFFV